MQILASGRHEIIKNVGCGNVRDISESLDGRYIVTVTSTMLVLYINSIDHFRPVARWMRSPRAGYSLHKACWSAGKHSFFVLTDDLTRICCFQILSTSSSSVNSDSSPSKLSEEDSPEYIRVKRRRCKNRKNRTFPRLLENVLGPKKVVHELLLDSASDDESSSLSFKPGGRALPMTMLDYDRKASSFAQLHEVQGFPLKIWLSTILRFPIEVSQIRPVSEGHELGWTEPLIFGLSQHPVIGIMQTAIDCGVKASIYLNKLAICGEDGFETLDNFLGESRMKSLKRNAALFAPEGKSGGKMVSDYLSFSTPDKRIAAFTRNDANRLEPGVEAISVSSMLNVVVVTLSDGLVVVLTYDTGLAPVVSYTGAPTRADSVLLRRLRLGRVAVEQERGVLSTSLIEHREELIVVLARGTVLGLDMSSWLAKGLVEQFECQIDVGYWQCEQRLFRVFCAPHGGAWLAYYRGTREQGKESEDCALLDRRGHRIAVMSIEKCEPVCHWTSWGHLLLVASGANISVIDLLSPSNLMMDFGIGCSNRGRTLCMISASKLVLNYPQMRGVEGSGFTSFTLPRKVADCPEEIEALSFQLNLAETWGLLTTPLTILVGHLRDRSSITWFDAFGGMRQGWGAYFSDYSQSRERFPYAAHLPTGWLSDSTFFYTSKFSVSKTSQRLYSLVFLRVEEGGIGSPYGLSFVGCSRPASVKPIRTCVLNEDWRWTGSCGSVRSDHSYNLLRDLFSPAQTVPAYKAATGVVEFYESPLGVFYENEALVCYRAHPVGTFCRHSQRCSSNFLKRQQGGGWSEPALCFESLYVCDTKLGRPIEIAFISDIFTVLVRSESNALRIGHICSSLNTTSSILALLQPKTLSFSRTHMVLSPSLLNDEVLAMTPFSKDDGQFIHGRSQYIWRFDYTVQSYKGDAIPLDVDRIDEIGLQTRMDRASVKFPAGVKEIDIFDDVYSPIQSSEFMRVGRAASHHTIRNGTHKPRTYSQAELLGTVPGWNLVSGTLRNLHPPDSISRSDSSAGSATLTSNTAQEKDGSRDSFSRGRKTGKILSDGRGSDLEENMTSLVDKLDRNIRGVTQAKNLEETPKNLRSEDFGEAKETGCSGGVEVALCTPSGTVIMKLTLSLRQFAPFSTICSRNTRKTLGSSSSSGELSIPDDRISGKLFTFSYGITIDYINRTSRHEGSSLLGHCSKRENVCQTLQGGVLRVCPDGAFREQNLWSVTNHPAMAPDLRILSHKVGDLADSEKDSLCSEEIGKALGFQHSPNAERFESAFADVVFNQLEEAIKAVKTGLKSELEDIPTLDSIQDALQATLLKQPVRNLYASLRLLKMYLANDANVVIQLSRISDPLLSPFILFPLFGMTMAKNFEHLIRSNQLRSAMALLLPLQQRFGPIQSRTIFGTTLIIEAVLRSDFPVVLDLVEYFLHPLCFSAGHNLDGDDSSKSSEQMLRQALLTAVRRALALLLEQCRWRTLISAITILRLPVVPWFKSMAENLELPWQRVLESHQKNTLVEDIEKTFYIQRRNICISCRETWPLSCGHNREILIGDWGVHVLFSASQAACLWELSDAILIATGNEKFRDQHRIDG